MFRYLVVIVASLLVAACSQDEGTAVASVPETAAIPATAPPPMERQLEFGKVVQGGRLFQQHCATCHGERAQGTVNWQQRDAQGFLPPPPLNGTAHAWHHSREVLNELILNGSADGRGRMPAWKGKLSIEEIDAIIAWIQSKWPDEIYQAWLEENPQ